jgi:CO/xanthine dehydrogenase Mo-binding subunit
VRQSRYNSSIWYAGQQALADEIMFAPVVRHIGDRVAVVVAETTAIARAAAAVVVVGYDEPPVADSPSFPDPIDHTRFEHGNPDAAFAAADLVVETHVSTPRSHHCAIETHACLAYPEADGRIAIVTPCQSVFAVQAVVAQATGMAVADLHVMKSPIGGSFGGKAEPVLDPICAWLAATLRRPVRIVLSRQETFVATRTRSAMQGRMRMALSRDGKILARDTQTRIDVGAYCTGGNYLPGSMLQRLVRLYDVPAERYDGRAVYSHSVPTGAFRGYGRVCQSAMPVAATVWIAVRRCSTGRRGGRRRAVRVGSGAASGLPPPPISTAATRARKRRPPSPCACCRTGAPNWSARCTIWAAGPTRLWRRSRRRYWG